MSRRPGAVTRQRSRALAAPRRGAEAAGEPRCAEKKGRFRAEAPGNPSKKLPSFPACFVSAGVHTRALKTVLLAVIGAPNVSFAWWKVAFGKRQAKV